MRPSFRSASLLAVLLVSWNFASFAQEADELSPADLAAVKAAQKQRVETIGKVYGAVVAIYGNDRAGGGSRAQAPEVARHAMPATRPQVMVATRTSAAHLAAVQR